ncbi:SRPBCC family protein [Gaetbulibacter sp. NE]|uniref:SRPBCC family protein n=1 Tax=Gaetbulibacter sp. NE TaxID=2982307 RepID=UPI0021D0EE68|nr:SRPBCC domain-containing protein [Gaetbulibacter sp. NE]
MSDKIVTVSQKVNTSIERVWKAITHKDQMKNWYFELEEFLPEKGFKFEFIGYGHTGEQFNHLCEITEVIPLKKLQYSWEYKGYVGKSFVTFYLDENAKSTTITVTHEGIETFPDHPDFDKSNFTGGWKHIIKKSLYNYLTK